jgi:hypothetical protein
MTVESFNIVIKNDNSAKNKSLQSEVMADEAAI